jgi:hypothetical protein
MTKKVTTTTDRYLESLTPEERKQFDKEFRNFALSEMILAAMAKDALSVRKLAKLADVSPTIVQAMRSGKKDDFAIKSIFKVLDSLGFRILLEREGEITPLDISWVTK